MIKNKKEFLKINLDNKNSCKKLVQDSSNKYQRRIFKIPRIKDKIK